MVAFVPTKERILHGLLLSHVLHKAVGIVVLKLVFYVLEGYGHRISVETLRLILLMSCVVSGSCFFLASQH